MTIYKEDTNNDQKDWVIYDVVEETYFKVTGYLSIVNGNVYQFYNKDYQLFLCVPSSYYMVVEAKWYEENFEDTENE